MLLSFGLLLLTLGVATPYAHAFELITSTSLDDALRYDPDVGLSTDNIIRRHGYPAQSHVVETEDGYLLTVHRIPGAPACSGNSSKQVVFLQHGMLGSSADWIFLGPGRALAYVLADLCYDVWLGNARGNTYSRHHVNLSSSDPAFWNFSWHEMGIYDLPAEIDYIMTINPVDKIFYVGHSMGTTMFYVMASTRPEYNDKILKMFSLAPIAFMSHLRSPLRLFAPFTHDIEFLERLLGAYEFLPQNKLLQLVSKYFCETTQLEKMICQNWFFLLCGYDPDQADPSLMPIVLSHEPAGISTKAVIHYAQEIRSGKFRPYEERQRHVLSHTPLNEPIAEYNLTAITAEISLHYSLNDYLASVQDVLSLAYRLTNVEKYQVQFEKFNHLDFMLGKDAKRFVYNKVIYLMQKKLNEKE